MYNVYQNSECIMYIRIEVFLLPSSPLSKCYYILNSILKNKDTFSQERRSISRKKNWMNFGQWKYFILLYIYWYKSSLDCVADIKNVHMYIRSYLSKLSLRCIYVCVWVCAQLLQSCLTFCDPMVHQVPLFLGFYSKHTRVGCHFLLLGFICVHCCKPLVSKVFLHLKTTKTEETSLYPYKGALGSTLPGKYLEKSNIIN